MFAALSGALWAACGFPSYGGFKETEGSGGAAASASGTGGSDGCAPGFADCDGKPENGCETDTKTSLTDCGKCNNACSANNGEPSCKGGVCAIACDDGFENCDGEIANGCETDTTKNVDHCGACNAKCPSAGGTPKCVAGECEIAACEDGFADCDDEPANGCETKIIDNKEACGGCGKKCFVPNGEGTCKGTTCAIASCEQPYDDCDDLYENGCETSLKTKDDCGACGEVCAPSNGEGTCSTGVCKAVCSAPFDDCDGNPNNGCETDASTSIKHCGGCNNACPSINGTGACVDGSCTITCAPEYGNCDLNIANGCETKVSSNLNHCGKCGNPCSAQNGTASCTQGKCAVQSCIQGWDDCDGMYETGCEANLQTGTDNCGACNKKCTNTNGTTACVAGKCTPSCKNGFDSCDGNPDNGCETSLTTPQDCGQCGNVCGTQNTVSSTCTAGACKLTCKPNFADCDGDPSNGCECTDCPNDSYEPNDTIQAPANLPMQASMKKLDPVNNVWKLSDSRISNYSGASFKNQGDVDVFYVEVQDDLLNGTDALFDIALSNIPPGATYGIKSYFICKSGAAKYFIYVNGTNTCSVMHGNVGALGPWYYCVHSAPATVYSYTYGHVCTGEDTSGFLQIEITIMTPPAAPTCNAYNLTVGVTPVQVSP